MPDLVLGGSGFQGRPCPPGKYGHAGLRLAQVKKSLLKEDQIFSRVTREKRRRTTEAKGTAHLGVVKHEVPYDQWTGRRPTCGWSPVSKRGSRSGWNQMMQGFAAMLKALKFITKSKRSH